MEPQMKDREETDSQIVAPKVADHAITGPKAADLKMPAPDATAPTQSAQSQSTSGPQAGDGKKPKRVLAKIASLALTAAFLGAIAWFVAQRLDEFKSLWTAPIPAYALWLLPPAWLLMTVVNSELLRKSLIACDLDLPVMEGLALTMASTAVNQIMPLKGGSALRTLYLVTRRGASLASWLAVMAAVTVMTLTTASVFALFGLAGLAFKGEAIAPALALYFRAAALAGPLSILFLGRLPVKLPSLPARILSGWDRVRSTPGLMWNLAKFQIAFFLSWALVNWLSLAAFQVRLSPGDLMFYAAGQIHATLLNLTPAGLGVVEAVSVMIGRVMGVDPAQALSAQALNRLTAILALAVLGSWGWLYLSKLKISGPALKEPGLEKQVRDEIGHDKAGLDEIGLD